ncbi:MAG TPA: phage tail sheath subtilisin-like domain-containing protein [Allosphingosinicella sp.]|uniref:phage tail sheath subtilisin-like domain-containing protein n=1 Tax=Allosphingosinicella sp. TaxID=2823234 RepID=UPI002EDAC713
MHGITVTEVNAGIRALVTAATSVIGLVATGPAADAATFPLDTPVAIVDMAAAIEDAGATGTLKGALQAIADQVNTVVVVVRVAPGADAAGTDANVLGASVDGNKTGMQALLAAEAQLGVKPRIIGAPGLDTQAVTAGLVIVAKKLRAMAYAYAVGDDVADAILYRSNFAARELMLITPNFLAAGSAESFSVARALGLRARIDREQGFHKTLSNVPVDGVIGLTKDYGFDIQDPTCEVNQLNDAEITSLINWGGGYRFWGSRTCSDDPLFAFESATRTAQVLMDTIADGLLWAIDKPLRPSLARDIVETINAKFRVMVRDGQLIGARAWFDADRNPAADLGNGKLTIDYEFTPVPPLEHLALTQRITDRFFADFAAGVNAG